MSDLEVVGVVISAMPLVISGLEHYAKGIRETKHFRKQKSEFDRLRSALRRQQNSFLNRLGLLLRDSVDTHARVQLLGFVDGETKWSEPHIEQALRRKLDDSYDMYLHIIRWIAHDLSSIQQILELNENGKICEPSFENILSVNT